MLSFFQNKQLVLECDNQGVTGYSNCVNDKVKNFVLR